MKIEKTKMQVRLPVDIREWLGNQADRYGGSVNATIIRLVRERMDAEAAKAASHAS